MFVNPVGEQDGVVAGIHAGAHSGHDTIGPSVVGRVPGAAQKAVGILDHELERNPTGLRAECPELTLRVAAYPQQHKVDNVGDIDVISRVGEGIWPGKKSLGFTPELPTAIVDILVVPEIIIGVDRIVVILRSAEVARGHVRAPALA